MNTHLLRLFVVAGSALTLNLSPALINQVSLTPSAHAQSKNKKKAKSFRGPSSRGTSNRQSSRQRSSSQRSGTRSQRSSSRSRNGFSGNLGILSNRNNRIYGNNRSYGNDRSYGSNRSVFSSGRSRSRSPFSSNRRNRGGSYGRSNNSLGLVIGLAALGLGNSQGYSNGYSSRRRYDSQPYGWRQHGWRSSSWKATYYEPPSYREPHSLWGQSHYHDTWGWYYYDIVNQSTFVFVDREPDNCDYIEYQDDILLECDKVLYRPSSYKGQKVFEIVDDY